MEFGSTTHNLCAKQKKPEPSENHSLCTTQSGELFISIISWKFMISKIEIRYDYKQNELLYNGRNLTCSYKVEYSEPTTLFTGSNI